MIRLTTMRYGPGYVQAAGTVISLPAYKEAELIGLGQAERVETTVRELPQTADKQTPRPRQSRPHKRG
jgi:hypothetical protein